MVESPSLTPDIERALQRAVGEANSAFSKSQTHEVVKIKKRKKRSKEEIDVGPTEANQEVKPRKKRKKNKPSKDPELLQYPDAQDDSAIDVRPGGVEEESGSTKGAQIPAPNGTGAASNEQQINSQISSPPSSAPQASSAAFLSAILAAAAETQSQQLPTTHSYHLPPYATFSSDQYGSQGQFANPQTSNPAALPLTDPMFGSNDDILRALHDLDMSKIAGVLKTLGDAAAAANVPLVGIPGFLLPSNNAAPASQPSNRRAVPSKAPSVAKSAKDSSSATSQKRTIDMSLVGPEHNVNPEHAHLLSTRWMSANKLAEMVSTDGLVYKKGKFSAIEDKQINDAIENFRIAKQLTPEQINETIFPKNEKAKDNVFWSEITAAVPLRPIIAVYHHVRRIFHPMKLQGKWTPSEDNALKRAVADHGQHWEKVSLEVGRMSSDCRDRYRNHIANRDVRVTGLLERGIEYHTGHWKPEEEAELTRIVTEMTVKQGKDIDNDVFWGKVSELMGNKRGRQQCRIKWTDSLSKTVKNDGQKPRWSQQDAYILVHKVDSMNVRDDTEIDWKTLSDPHWNLWSAHALQRRWLSMKRAIKGFEDMTHQEIMDILRVKKAQLPADPAVPARKRKVTSAEVVIDPDTSESSSSSQLDLDDTELQQ